MAAQMHGSMTVAELIEELSKMGERARDCEVTMVIGERKASINDTAFFFGLIDKKK